VRVRDLIERERAEEGEKERGRGGIKAVVVLLLPRALVLVTATRRRSCREAWTRLMLVMVSGTWLASRESRPSVVAVDGR